MPQVEQLIAFSSDQQTQKSRKVLNAIFCRVLNAPQFVKKCNVRAHITFLLLSWIPDNKMLSISLKYGTMFHKRIFFNEEFTLKGWSSNCALSVQILFNTEIKKTDCSHRGYTNISLIKGREGKEATRIMNEIGIIGYSWHQSFLKGSVIGSKI